MTIRRKLYFGFGAILAIMLALFVVNMFTVVREHAARSAAAATLSDVEIIENVRFQMIANRTSFVGGTTCLCSLISTSLPAKT